MPGAAACALKPSADSTVTAATRSTLIAQLFEFIVRMTGLLLARGPGTRSPGRRAQVRLGRRVDRVADVNLSQLATEVLCVVREVVEVRGIQVEDQWRVGVAELRIGSRGERAGVQQYIKRLATAQGDRVGGVVEVVA